jgi:N utilization substance protein B
MIDSDQIKNLYREFSKRKNIGPTFNWILRAIRRPSTCCSSSTSGCRGRNCSSTWSRTTFPSGTKTKASSSGPSRRPSRPCPLDQDFYATYEADSEAVQEFGLPLLKFVVEADAQLLERIKSVLENWDADRVAIIDMILIKMALGEFTQFKDIPSTVTLNEYLDISKNYSTDKSREFINGVLDKLLAELKAQGLVA